MAFTPVSLFGSGEQGVIYDVQTLSSMFQDSAGTVPAVVDSPVGRINDLSGNNNHAVQATSGMRPMLRQDASGYYLDGDGVDDYLTALFTIAQPVTRVSRLDMRTWVTSKHLIGGGNVVSGALFTNAASPQICQYAGSVGASVSRLQENMDGLITEIFNGASSSIGVNQDTRTASSPGTNGFGGITLFAQGSSKAATACRIHGVVMINRVLTAQEIENTQSFLTRFATRVVVIDGDSNSYAPLIGYGLQYRPNAVPSVFLQNIAVSGTGLDTNPTDMYLRAAEIDARIPADKRGRQYVYFPWWSNNLPTGAFNGGVVARTPVEYAAAAGSYLQARKAAGWDKVGIGTVLERTDAGQDNSATRAAYNTIISDASWRASYGIDFFVDFASEPTVGAVGASANTTYFETDKVHLLSAGHALLEPIFRAAVNGIPISVSGDMNTRLRALFDVTYSRSGMDLTTGYTTYAATVTGDANNRLARIIDDATP